MSSTITTEIIGNLRGPPGTPGTQGPSDFNPDLPDKSVSGITASLVAGEDLLFGDICYMNVDGKMWKASALNINTGPAIAVARGPITVNTHGSFLFTGFIRNDFSYNFNVSRIVFLSVTAGGITQVAPSMSNNVIQSLGMAITPSIIYFTPQYVLVEHT